MHQHPLQNRCFIGSEGGSWCWSGCCGSSFREKHNRRQHLAVPSGDLAKESPTGSVPCVNPLASLSTACARTQTGAFWWAHESSEDTCWRGPWHHPNQFKLPNDTWRRFIAKNACE